MTKLTLTAPLIIGPRLMPAVRVGDNVTGGIISLDPSDLTWYIDTFDPDTPDVSGGEFSHPRFSDGNDDQWVRSAMGALLGFLSAFAEAHNPRWGGEDHEQWDLFPVEVGEWAYLNDDEISMACMELEGDTE